ncbi:MAG: hypothetical protein R3181_01225 [Rubricoccaceae bacterium]|nr:hypothetical protein [Rubricoccaceae bacterium]
MRRLFACVLGALVLSACDFAGLVESSPEPVAFTRIVLTAAPLPDDEDGSPTDLYVEIQDAGGAAVYRGAIEEDVSPSIFPYTVVTDGAIVGERQSHYVVVLDYDPSGYRYIGRTGPFTGDALRAAEDSLVVQGDGPEGFIEATIIL